MKTLFIILLFLIISVPSFAQMQNNEVIINTSTTLPTKDNYKGKNKRTFKKIITCIKHIVTCSESLANLKPKQRSGAEKGIQENIDLLEKYSQELNLSDKQVELLIINFYMERDYGVPLSYTLKSQMIYFSLKFSEKNV